MIDIFTTDYSFGARSILAIPESKKKNKEDPEPKVRSVFDIVKKHDLKEIFVIDNSFGGFYELYTGAKKAKTLLRFGLIMNVVNNLSEGFAGTETSSEIIIWLKNSKSYSKINNIIKFANTEGFICNLNSKGEKESEGNSYIDWNFVNNEIDEDFVISIPFYSGFLAKNIFSLNNFATPFFSSRKEVNFIVSKQGLPFDELIHRKTKAYCGDKFKMLDARHVYYYTKEEAKELLLLKTIDRRTSWEMPEVKGFSSNQFAYLK